MEREILVKVSVNMDWNKLYWNEQEILITGGTGSLGKAITKELLTKYYPKGVRIYSRDELKQSDMKLELQKEDLRGCVSFIIGDVRDKDRLALATRGVNIIIHAAAMKRIEICEQNPLEAIDTNVIGSMNVLFASLRNNVEKAMLISTDKAVFPINLYGATKLCAEKLFINGNVYTQGKDRVPRFSVCRYGNVAGSRGSVIPLFKEQAKKGKLFITSMDATRFWITLPEAVDFVLTSIGHMKGGETFIPKMPSFNIQQLANALLNVLNLSPRPMLEQTGFRVGEKMHEAIDKNTTSRNNPWRLTPEELEEKIRGIICK